MDAISEILLAANSLELFGTNEKRAKLRYRRLAKEVHPDSNDDPKAEEAMKRLNSLWRKYNTRVGAVADERTPEEITRNETFAVFSEGEKWMVVERSPNGDGHFGVIQGVNDTLDGTPVRILECDRTKTISQPDGLHLAYETTPPESIVGGHGIMLLSNMNLFLLLPGGLMDPADFAWISKRVLFLSTTLAEYGATLGSKVDCLAIAPDSHMLVVVDDVVESTDPWGDRDELIRQYIERVGRIAIRGINKTAERIERFMLGVIGDRWASTGELMREYDELMYELFGGIHWHEMELNC